MMVGMFIQGLFLPAEGQTANDRILSALRQNDHSVISGYLHSLVDLQVPGYNGNFSQSQASFIVKQFLSETPVSSVILTREDINSDGSRYTLGELVAGGKRYRLYFVTRETEGKWKVFLFHLHFESSILN